MQFSSLGLKAALVSNLETIGYLNPTPVQLAAIPEILANYDVMAGAQTGTGKTAAFALPLIQRLSDTKAVEQERLRVLVLTPTRELAQQVHLSFVKYSQGLSIDAVVAYGGASINPQIAALEKGCDILIATPGRLLELAIKQLIDLSYIQTLVLDEADRMLDMGFIIDIKRILKRLPDTHQTLFFSATFNDDVFALSKTLLNQPKLIEVSARNTAIAKVEQRFYEVNNNQKAALTAYLIGAGNWQQVLIFTRTKQGADELAKELEKDGISAVAIHGDKSQGARERGLEEFRTGKVRTLVATDVAARGLDIQQLGHVINFELPYNAEDYIHRIGRTGRAGQEGVAVSLVSAKERYLLAEIEKLTQSQFSSQWVPGFEPDHTTESQSDNRRQPSKKSLRAKALGDNSGKQRNRRQRRQRR